MKLTGKAKEQFEAWYLKLIRVQREDYNKFDDYTIIKKFYRSIQSMQWGVIQDFADSLGYDIIAESTTAQDKYWFTIYTLPESITEEKMFDTRQEARNAAIEKLNEIINQA